MIVVLLHIFKQNNAFILPTSLVQVIGLVPSVSKPVDEQILTNMYVAILRHHDTMG